MKTAQTQLQPPRTAAESRGLLKTEALDTHALEPEKADPELQVARAQIRQQQDTITHLQRQVREVVSIVRNTEHHLAAVAKTRPYRFAHFLRRWERDCLKGDWEDRKAFARWLLRRLGGRQTPVEERRNPLLITSATGCARVRDHSEDLHRILHTHRGKPIIVLRPIIYWDVALFQRPHHLAQHLGAEGFLYFFCTWDLPEDAAGAFTEVSPGCYVTDQFALLDSLPARITHLYSTDNTCDLAYVRYRQASGDLILYEYIDQIHAAISRMEIPHATWTRHHALLADPDVACVVTADQLLSEVRAARTHNVALITNGADVGHFSPSTQMRLDPPQELRNLLRKAKPIIGYFGALASWFDYALVELAARERPQYEWLLIGMNYDGSIDRTHLRDLPNVTILDPIAYQILPRYACHFDVSTIPFVLNEITLSTSPIKLFEYMALGKPIVTTDMPECRKYAACLVAGSPGEFPRLLDEAMEMRQRADYLAALRDVAQANSWAHKARDLAALLRVNLASRQDHQPREADRDAQSLSRNSGGRKR